MIVVINQRIRNVGPIFYDEVQIVRFVNLATEQDSKWINMTNSWLYLLYS